MARFHFVEPYAVTLTASPLRKLITIYLQNAGYLPGSTGFNVLSAHG